MVPGRNGVWLSALAAACLAAGCVTSAAPPRSPAPSPAAVADLLDPRGDALPVRFMGSPISGLTQHTASAAGEDFDPDVGHGMLVFASTRHSEFPNLYLRRSDGGVLVQLTNDRFSNIQPALSPDGRRVAFASNRGGNWDIFIMSLEGNEVVQVTNGEEQEVHPTWSPDGTRLAYSGLSRRSGQWEIQVVPADAAGSVFGGRMVVTEGLFPVWSRTGRIAYQSSRGGSPQGGEWFSIWSVSVEGDRVSRPAEVVSAADWGAIAPAWSADGTRLAFAAVHRDRARGSSRDGRCADSVWIVRADGAEMIRLTPEGDTVGAPAWGDDGRVYFVSDRAGGRHIWSVRPACAPPSVAAEARAAAREGPPGSVPAPPN